ncbi:hypothetical protein B0H14DRAFT_3652251 [Mycena olivaceomarginata]|nr:hypothetical protein B0H14DRAFT_3652251 [Mycena olivaceomarginata]
MADPGPLANIGGTPYRNVRICKKCGEVANATEYFPRICVATSKTGKKTVKNRYHLGCFKEPIPLDATCLCPRGQLECGLKPDVVRIETPKTAQVAANRIKKWSQDKAGRANESLEPHRTFKDPLNTRAEGYVSVIGPRRSRRLQDLSVQQSQISGSVSPVRKKGTSRKAVTIRHPTLDEKGSRPKRQSKQSRVVASKNEGYLKEPAPQEAAPLPHKSKRPSSRHSDDQTSVIEELAKVTPADWEPLLPMEVDEPNEMHSAAPEFQNWDYDPMDVDDIEMVDWASGVYDYSGAQNRPRGKDLVALTSLYLTIEKASSKKAVRLNRTSKRRKIIRKTNYPGPRSKCGGIRGWRRHWRRINVANSTLKDNQLACERDRQVHMHISWACDGDDTHKEWNRDGQRREQQKSQSQSNGEFSEGQSEEARAAAIAESRKKIEELERDKDIWRKAAERRTAIEQEDEQLFAAEKQRRQQEKLAAQIKQQANAREIENNRIKRWKEATILEESRQLQDFRNEKFSELRPLTAEIIHWPVAVPAHITQQALLEFASLAKQLGPAPRKVLAREILRAFHPDKAWIGRLETLWEYSRNVEDCEIARPRLLTPFVFFARHKS